MILEKIENNEKLIKFKELVLKENEVMNLTSITDEKEFLERHLFDSLTIVDYFDFKNKKVLDIGTGGGFPGIPLAICLPDTYFYLVETTVKKCLFLERVVKILDLKNVKIINKRVEDLPFKYRSYFDFSVSRAVSQLNILLELAIPYLKVNGKLIAYKGIKYQEELDVSKNALNALSSSVEKIINEKLPFSNEPRFNIIINKDMETNKNFPRLYSQIKKRPL